MVVGEQGYLTNRIDYSFQKYKNFENFRELQLQMEKLS